LPDSRLHACRADLADARLRGVVAAARYVDGRPAWVIAGLAPVRHSPAPEAALDTVYHYGEPVLIFDEAGEYAWCQSLLDGYVGYTLARHLIVGKPPSPTRFVASMGAYRYETPDLRAAPIDFLPRHSGVTIAETGLVTRGTEYARLDRGGFLPLSCLSPTPPRSRDLAVAASLYIGCPYLWGGRSFLGVDCSGLVQQGFRDLGVAVPRDTDMQQTTIGVPIAVRRHSDFRRGDLIYLPGHVMIHAGGGAVIHADGASMTVRRDRLAGLMRARRLDFGQFTVRRYMPNSAV